jgi:chorismate mutase/prephenate dehydratase
LVGRIDQIDEQLLALLAERGAVASELARRIDRTGEPSVDPAIEEQRIVALEERWHKYETSKFPRNGIRHIFREILSACASINTPVRVAYLGPEGTFSHLALLQEFGSSTAQVECSSISNVFSAVERGKADYGVLPIENSIEGGVTPTHDCLVQSTLMIHGEFVLGVKLCLVGGERDFGLIERVYSHPQPLAQSRLWLGTHLPHTQSIACVSTTVAARQAAADPRGAAVSSNLGAELHGLAVLAEGIEDVPGNATRFVIIARTDAAPTGHDKTSVVFSTPDQRGALMRVLSIFDAEGLNLCRIESRPDRSKRWEYVFFTDIEGHRNDAPIQRAIGRLQLQCQMVRVLGSYPQANDGASSRL